MLELVRFNESQCRSAFKAGWDKSITGDEFMSILSQCRSAFKAGWDKPKAGSISAYMQSQCRSAFKAGWDCVALTALWAARPVAMPIGIQGGLGQTS